MVWLYVMHDTDWFSGRIRLTTAPVPLTARVITSHCTLQNEQMAL